MPSKHAQNGLVSAPPHKHYSNSLPQEMHFGDLNCISDAHRYLLLRYYYYSIYTPVNLICRDLAKSKSHHQQGAR